jgi:hypothetical protein
MKWSLLILFLSAAFPMPAMTTNNNDSCDISVAPAATLLLPYFEVDVSKPPAAARTTLFTIVNTSSSSQIARVTLWTDYAYPEMTFSISLTGFDTQSINLYDLLGPEGMTLPPAAYCGREPLPVPDSIAANVRSAFTNGTNSTCGTAKIGGTHTSAIGYATIDVAKSCASDFPTNPSYYDGLSDDNVLIGDWEMVDPDAVTGNYASGSPLVHIRAIETTTLPYTFYDRFTTKDHRQPLPSVFAARFIQGTPAATTTNFLIWREGILGSNAACTDYVRNAQYSAGFCFDDDGPDLVRFDEHENPVLRPRCPKIAAVQKELTPLPATSSAPSNTYFFPALSASGDIGGWMYMNLIDTGAKINGRSRASQDWVVVSMRAQGRYSVAFDAAAIVNGCTPATKPGGTIGP